VPAPRSSLRRRPLLALLTLILLLVVGYAARAVQDHSHRSGAAGTAPATATVSGAVPLSSLPAQARQTVALIQRGGPFPYSHDGIVYQNLERQLPPEPAGFYHEYTVATPGSSDRGARRIVTGRDGSFYYTDDHYASFRRVDLGG
jgi:ribonuclease T1